MNLGKLWEFQNKFRERLKVKTLELLNPDQIEINKINILKKLWEKFYKKLENSHENLKKNLCKFLRKFLKTLINWMWECWDVMIF